MPVTSRKDYLFKQKPVMKRLLILMLSTVCLANVYAGHIAGGEMFYTYVSAGSAANTNRYLITLRLFRECNPLGQAAELPDVVRISIFKGSNSLPVINKDVIEEDFQVLKLKAPLSCIQNPPDICYQVASYSFTADLPVVPEEYTAAYQTCCRSNSIVNVQQLPIPETQFSGEGSTYSCNIPGTNILATGVNSSAVFSLKDTVLICSGKKIDLDFSATDADHDLLSYSFCAAYNRGVAVDSRIITPSAPPYRQVTYQGGFSGGSPLGAGLIINPQTGKISGPAPAAGSYVVNVCVAESRNGSVISIHRKDFIVRVSNCNIPAAELNPVYTSCDGYVVNFANESTTAANIESYFWDFGTAGQTSLEPLPQFTYKDTGTYNVKLVVNRGKECTDSATTLVKVYPGFKPDFTVSGSCLHSPIQFKDATSTAFGVVNSWQWLFDNNNIDDDISLLPDPTHVYTTSGMHTAQLIVANNKGCIDTVSKEFTVQDKPLITVPFKDTLICKNDSLQLGATADIPANYSWVPALNISNANVQQPLVYPVANTLYIVKADDGKGCINTDTIQVNVADHATLDIGKDTAICFTDTVQFHPQSNALYFAWTADNTLSSTTIKEPFAVPVSAVAVYSLRAAISKKCFADDKIVVNTAPYPQADAGTSSTICYGYTTQLSASFRGSLYAWSPVSSLLRPGALTPIAGPQTTTTYTFTVKDTAALGCPKPVSDTVTVIVIPPVHLFAGNDTNIVVTQPLQLKATGADYYQWGPVIGMTNPESSSPIVMFNEPHAAVAYHVKGTTTEGCVGYDTVVVYIYKTLPEIFIPTAFTPNGDGLNDKLIPVIAGVKKLENFSIYNRWGQLLYSTAAAGQGWDGTVGGNKQPAGTYIYLAKAIDYLGKTIIKKGSVVLIR